MTKKVFVIDDNVSNLTMAKDALKSYYTVMTFSSSKMAIAPLSKIKPDIILLDIEMPEMDGFEMLQYLKSDESFREIPIIFLTSRADHKTEIDALKMGVVDFITKPFNPAILLNRVKHHVDINGLIQERAALLFRAQHDLIFVMADMVENRDESTGDHLGRTSRLIKTLLDAMLEKRLYYDRIKDWDFNLLAECSVLHDVGKINTPDYILKKPGKLTDEEYNMMKEHVMAGVNIINKVVERSGENIFLHHSRIFAMSHHEKWNGTGYPQGLSGDDIPLQGRIMAIADVYDALISERVYKKAFTIEETMNIITSEKGKHFDPNIVDILCEIQAEGI